MYSSLKNHSNNLQYCQRFYYNAYEYYNDYQKPQDYQDDLSKLFFKCKRKTTATIWCYNNPYNQPFLQNRAIRLDQQSDQKLFQFKNKKTSLMNQEQSGKKQQQQNTLTMQDFLNRFVEIFHQNNFSDFKNDLQQNKNKHRIVYFPHQRILQAKTSNQRGKNFNLQLDFIQYLMETFDNKIKKIKHLYQEDKIDVDDISFYASQLTYQTFNQYQMQSLLKNKEQGSKVISTYNLFKNMIQNLLDQLCDSQSFSHLVLYIPKLPILNYLFNPLVSGIYTFLRKEESLSKSDYLKTQQAEREVPKVVLINLDSRQTPTNLRTINQCSSVGLMYITIYNQSLYHDQVQDQENQISDMISKLMIKQIEEANKTSTQDKKNKGKNYTEVPKIFAFPLNSNYIKNYLKQKHGRNSDINCSLSGSSEDIMFLFDNVIFQQIRNFCPNIIMINYNGTLNINEQHFSKIIRTLTIISDHRIVLFPNYCNLFQTNIQKSLNVPSQEFAQQRDLDYEMILKTKSYIEKYHQIDLNQIDIHNFFNNIAMFLKLSSGTYSFEQRYYSPSSVFQKYQAGLKYEYLQRLSELQQFKYYSKFTSKHLKGQSLMKLMEKQRKQCIEKNIDNAPLYKSLLDEAVQQILKESDSLPKNIRYKAKKIARSFGDNQQKLYSYLDLKKDRLLIQTIKAQKIKKAYYVKASTRQAENDHLHVYTFRQLSEQKEEIFLQNYSQVIFQQLGDKFLNVFIINARDDNDKLKMMFGQTKINGYQVYLVPFQNTTEGNITSKMQSMCIQQDESYRYLEYVNYSYTFFKNQLYLFWPYEWDLKTEAQCLMTGIQYTPRIVNRMVRVTVQVKEKKLNVFSQTLNYIPKTNFIPRLNAGAWMQNLNTIYVFGGICNDKNDFQIIDSGCYKINIQHNQFSIQPIPKQLNKSKIRPKLNYVVQKKDEDTLLISGGHGRQFTNFFNIFSYHTYEFNIKTYGIKMIKSNRKVIQLPKPMFTRKQGRFQMAKDKAPLSNLVKIQQRVSNQPKYKFILCRKGFFSQKEANKNNAVTFLDDDYTTTIYNKQNSFGNIFSTNKTFENIYSQRFCSPQIYVWNKSRDLTRIQILVQVSKQVNEYAIKQFIFPNEDSLIAFCIHTSHQKLYLLAKSAIYTRNMYILYEGSLKNSQQIANQKQLKMKIFFEFKSGIYKLQQKAMYSQDHRLMICGGQLNNYNIREDYLLERIKGKYKLKIIKIAYPQNPFILEMKNPYILQTLEEEFMMYTVCLGPDEKWVIRMEIFSVKNDRRTIKESVISLNAFYQEHIYKINPLIMKLKFLNISRYSRFSFEYFRGKSHALLIQMNKLQQQFDLNELEEEIKYKILIFILKNSYETIEQKIPYIYTQFKKFANYIVKEKFEDAYYIEKSILTWEILLILVNYKIQQGFYNSLRMEQRKKIQNTELYRFILEDKSRPLTKYVALGELGTTKLTFFQIKTRKPLISNMFSTIGGQEQYGVNISQKGCSEVYFDQIENFKNDILFQRAGQWQSEQQKQYEVQTEVFRNTSSI